MASIGLIAGSMKPVQAGHWSLITRAAAENDHVLLFISTSDRKRKGQVPIIGADMERIWKEHLIPELPSNVDVKLGGVPVRQIWETLGEANESGSTDTFRIYSDPEDLANRFSPDKFEKYTPDLWAAGQIEPMPISREGGINISGTQMREFLASGDQESFKRYLPPVPEESKDAIWNLLSSRLSEGLLRSWIRGLI